MRLTCPQCGAEAGDAWKFCERCGASMTSPVPSPRATSQGADEGKTASIADIAGRVAAAVRERGYHAYVHRIQKGVGLTERAGFTRITPLDVPGEARLVQDAYGGRVVLIDGKPRMVLGRVAGCRELICLTQASYRGPAGEQSHYNVTTLERLTGDLFLPRLPEDRVEYTDEQFAAFVGDFEKQPGVALVHAPEPDAPAAPPPMTADEALARLDRMVGLAEVKEEVRALTDLVRVRKMRRERGMPAPPRGLPPAFRG